MPRQRREVSIYRIAKEAGVSAATVSRVINRRVGVSEETRARIDELLRHYHFLPDYPAKRAPKIALVIPSGRGILNDYVRKGLTGVFDYTTGHDIDVSLIQVRSRAKSSLLQQVRDQQCSGVIAMLAEGYEQELPALNDSGLPVILLDVRFDFPNLGYIDNDSYSGSCAAARYLLELGHRRIGYLCHAQVTNINHRDRLRGYHDTLAAAGITPPASWITHCPPLNEEPARGLSGLRTMELLLQQAPEITAVMAIDDDMALGALTAIHQSGRKIPGDISLIGFDNYSETRIWYPALTTVDHPIELAGSRAAEEISRAWANPGTWTPPREVLPTHLIPRASTGPAKAQI